MERLINIKPVYLYLLSGLFFVLSRWSPDGSVLDYAFLLTGIDFNITPENVKTTPFL